MSGCWSPITQQMCQFWSGHVVSSAGIFDADLRWPAHRTCYCDLMSNCIGSSSWCGMRALELAWMGGYRRLYPPKFKPIAATCFQSCHLWIKIHDTSSDTDGFFADKYGAVTNTVHMFWLTKEPPSSYKEVERSVGCVDTGCLQAQQLSVRKAGKEEKRPLLAAMRAPCLPALVPAISGGAWVKNSKTQTIPFFSRQGPGGGDKRQDGHVVAWWAIRNSGRQFLLRNASFVCV